MKKMIKIDTKMTKRGIPIEIGMKKKKKKETSMREMINIQEMKNIKNPNIEMKKKQRVDQKIGEGEISRFNQTILIVLLISTYNLMMYKVGKYIFCKISKTLIYKLFCNNLSV